MIDAAIAHMPLILEFIRQGQKELVSLNDSVTTLVANFGA
jgi:flagellar biosynthesis/type III secretory pathway ATPase